MLKFIKNKLFKRKSTEDLIKLDTSKEIIIDKDTVSFSDVNLSNVSITHRLVGDNSLLFITTNQDSDYFICLDKDMCLLLGEIFKNFYKNGDLDTIISLINSISNKEK